MMRRRDLWLAIVAVIVAVSWLLARAPRTAPPPPALTSEERDALARMNRLLPRDAIAPIYQPRLVPASQARLRPDELVLGIALGGEARAYPITILNSREMVNDELGGVPILATW